MIKQAVKTTETLYFFQWWMKVVPKSKIKIKTISLLSLS